MGQEKTIQSACKVVYVTMNPDQLSYVREKLGVAVWKLATGADGIKSRLADAFIELTILHENDFPSTLRDEWKQIIYELTSGKMQYNIVFKNGSLENAPVGLLWSTLRYMRTSKAQNIAERICNLEEKLNLQSEIHNEE